MAFVLSKVLWIVFTPTSLLLALLATGLVLREAASPTRQKTGRRLCWIATAVFLMIAVFPVGTWALTPLENRTNRPLPDRVDGIVVIGGDEQPDITQARGQPTALDSLRRHTYFAYLAEKYPTAKLVFSGGSGRLTPPEALKDSEVAEAVLERLHVPAHRLIVERDSRNTHENAVFAAQKVSPKASEQWLLVTSAWHMPRAIGCFRQAGWSIAPAPTGFFTTGKVSIMPVFRFNEQMRLLAFALHEYVGLVAYRLMGRTTELWPTP